MLGHWLLSLRVKRKASENHIHFILLSYFTPRLNALKSAEFYNKFITRFFIKRNFITSNFFSNFWFWIFFFSLVYWQGASCSILSNKVCFHSKEGFIFLSQNCGYVRMKKGWALGWRPICPVGLSAPVLNESPCTNGTFQFVWLQRHFFERVFVFINKFKSCPVLLISH